MKYNLGALEVKYSGSKKALHQTLKLLSSSGRKLPAHFCDNGFGIKTRLLTEIDQREMANVAWHETGGIREAGSLDTNTNALLILIGENLMLGHFLLVKLNQSKETTSFAELINKSARKYLYNTIDTDQIDDLLDYKAIYYFSHCSSYGYKRGQAAKGIVWPSY